MREAEAAGNLEIVAAVRAIQATMDPTLTDMQRIEQLEETYTRLTAAHARDPLLHPVSLGLAKRLIAVGASRGSRMVTQNSRVRSL